MPISDRRLFAAAALLVLLMACSKNSTTPTPTAPTCTVTAGAISASTFSAVGGAGSVPVTAGSGCTWTATISAAFVTITAGASGSGNGTVNFTVAADTGAARTATLTIAGTTYAISQSAAVPPPPGSFSAVTPNSPTGGQTVTGPRPTLVVNNATATGSIGPVTYRFEVSDLPTFPDDAVRTFTVDGIVQGSGGTTSWALNRDLGAGVLWYWHARATDGIATSAYSSTETFRTAGACDFTVSPTSASVGSGGGIVTITVTTVSTCNWTATSNTSFIAVTSGMSGSGTVTATVAANSGAARSGTLTVAGQTVTINQSGGAIVAGFRMLDPSWSGASPTAECRITNAFGSTCVLESTSFPLGTNGLVSYAWTVQWTDGAVITRAQSGASPSFSFTWTCGGPASTDDGSGQPLSVTLTVTDTDGNTATAASGSGNQPPVFIRLFKC